MAVATTIRQDLADQAQTLLLNSGLVDDVFEVVPGKLEGPQVDKDRGCVWAEAVEPGADKALEEVELHLRVFKRFYVSRGADLKPYDPTTLEAVGETLQTSFNGLRTAVGSIGGWYEVIRQEFDQDMQMVEVTLLGYAHNMFAPSS